MEFYTVEINSTIFKTFRTLPHAINFVNTTCDSDDKVSIYHEEYSDDLYSDAHGYKKLVFQIN
jgi:hypothetical protein